MESLAVEKITDFDLGTEVEKSVRSALKKLGVVNILVAGKTGVGKSTLVNSVFQGNIATTGQGRPVTMETREYTKEGIPVSILDTRGLEMAKYKQTLGELENVASQRRSDPDPLRHIHAAWVCITEDSRRVEDGESEAVRMLSKYMPVIVVITQSSHDNGFRSNVQSLLPDSKNVVRVRAIGHTDDEGNVFRPMGLENLLDATLEVIPEARKNAFAAAQKVNVKLKSARAGKVIAGTATAAAAIGATPIPFSDAVALVPLQIGMLAGISAVFGLNLTKSFLGTIAGSALSATGATAAGRSIVAGLLKFIPGAGSAVGGAIAAGTAALITTTLGGIYVKTLEHLFINANGEVPTEEEIAREFSRMIKKKRD